MSLIMGVGFGCADIEGDMGQEGSLEKRGFGPDTNAGPSGELSDLYGYSSGDSSGDTQGDWYQDEQSAYNTQPSTTTQTNQPVQASNGQSCGNGCIWSTMAVSYGAQYEEARCEGEACACVVSGDIWSSCAAPTDTNNGGGAQPGDTNTAPPSQPNTPQGYNASVGNRIADAARSIATRRNTVGYCYSAAADAIESVTGPFLWGSSAYMAADQLAGNSWFTEVSVSDLRTLPAGAVVVWGRGSSEHGHISIALGDGREASDHIDYQMTYHYGGAPARVFYPR